MQIKTILLILSVIIPATVSLAGESLSLDKAFDFHLDQTAPTPPAPVPFPGVPPQSERGDSDTLKTPEGERLPPGSQKREFNGQAYYFIPLGA